MKSYWNNKFKVPQELLLLFATIDLYDCPFRNIDIACNIEQTYNWPSPFPNNTILWVLGWTFPGSVMGIFQIGWRHTPWKAWGDAAGSEYRQYWVKGTSGLVLYISFTNIFPCSDWKGRSGAEMAKFQQNLDKILVGFPHSSSCSGLKTLLWIFFFQWKIIALDLASSYPSPVFSDSELIQCTHYPLYCHKRQGLQQDCPCMFMFLKKKREREIYTGSIKINDVANLH